MAIDMKNIKVNDADNGAIDTKSTELSDTKQTETPANDVKLIDNTSDNSENASEKAEQKPADSGEKKVVVQYIGHGVWRDAAGKVWSAVDNKHADILSSRSYSVDEYDKRDDLKFMEQYGEIKVTIV